MSFSLDMACRLGELDAHAQALLVNDGDLSALDLVEAALVRIETMDSVLSAVSYRADRSARRCAEHLLPRGRFAGVPFLAKDSLDYVGMPTRAGSRSRSGVLCRHAWPYASRLDRTGLIPVGKSAMPEFGLMTVTEPLLREPVHNPWSLRYSPGGSSGGAAAAVAAGLVPLAHGSDGAGSIRVPASACGVIGLKPGRGANVRARHRNMLDDLMVADCLLARSVRDVAGAFAACHPDDSRVSVIGPDTRRLRIAVVEPSLEGDTPHEEVCQGVWIAADVCARLGHHVTRQSWPVDGAATMQALRTLWAHMTADMVDAVRSELGGYRLEDALEPWTLGLAQQAESLSIDVLEHAFTQVVALPKQLHNFHQQFDVLLSPVTLSTPPPLGTYAPDRDFDELDAGMFRWSGYSPLQNLAGTPAISLPLHWTPGGLPVGVMFAADRGQEDLLLSLAFELEQALPWGDRWPPVSVANCMGRDTGEH